MVVGLAHSATHLLRFSAPRTPIPHGPNPILSLSLARARSRSRPLPLLRLFSCVFLLFTWWDVAVYVFDINQPTCPFLLILFLCLILSFMALSTVFHSIDSPDNSPLSHSVLPVIFLPFCPFNYTSLYESLPQP